MPRPSTCLVVLLAMAVAITAAPAPAPEGLFCPGCPACNCLNETSVVAFVIEHAVLVSAAVREIRRKAPGDCVPVPGRSEAVQRAFPNLPLCTGVWQGSGNCVSCDPELRNLVLHPPSVYDGAGVEDVQATRNRAQQMYQRSQYKSNCTSIFHGVNLKFVYLNALDALAASEDRPLWWIAENQVEIRGWDNPPDCELRLHVHPFNVTAWIEHVRNYTQPSPRV
jgi:hypothetical protein